MESSGGEHIGKCHAQFCQVSATHGVSWAKWLTGMLLLGLIGTWLVWFSFLIQRQHNEEAIRAACQRVMPETAERCVDTVIIQRGGVRR